MTGISLDGDYYDREGRRIDGEAFIRLFSTDYQRIDRTVLEDVTVSTVWLGINHAFIPTLPPLIFETMVFGGSLDNEQERYSTEEEALAGHAKWVQRVQTGWRWGDDEEDAS